MASKTLFFCDFCEKELTDDDHFNSINVKIETEYKTDPTKDKRVSKHVLLCDACFNPSELAIFAAMNNKLNGGAP